MKVLKTKKFKNKTLKNWRRYKNVTVIHILCIFPTFLVPFKFSSFFNFKFVFFTSNINNIVYSHLMKYLEKNISKLKIKIKIKPHIL